jgi:aminoglycoside phosphotransferase (APT) family kinase protein
VDRSPLFLAALASAAVPGLDPASVEALPGQPDHQYDVAFIQDTQHRRWVIRAPRSQAAAAQMESTFSLLALLARRLPFSVPTPKGFVALKEGGRAAIYPYLPGQNIDFAHIPPGPGLAAELGRAIAALHNADHGLFDEAGLPAYDADTYRTRRLGELDRAAATGHVPTGLLARWEKLLEDVALWRFAPTPTHGDLTGDQVLAVFDDEQDSATGRVKAITGWEDAKVADPADDFSALVTELTPEALETLMEAYSHARSERPDSHLLTRARLSAEMRTLSELLGAVASGDQVQAERHAAALRRLDEQVHAEQEAASDYRRPPLAPARRGGPVLVPPAVVEDDEADPEVDEDVQLMFGPRAGTAPDDEADTGPDEADTAPDDEDDPAEEDSREDADRGEPGVRRASATEDTTEVDVSSLREPQLILGDDPGPEWEPGASPGPRGSA